MSLLPTNQPPAAAPDSVIGGSSSALDRMADFARGITKSNTDLANALIATGAEPTIIYFPPDMVGGTCPLVEGQEAQMAWQAAAEALDCERVHYVYQVHDGAVWYLAVKSADFASHTLSWCPFAALLPGSATATPAPVCYLLVEQEASVLMAVTTTELHIHRGAGAVIQAKAERLAYDMGGAPIIRLLPDLLDKLTPVAWQSASLLEDKARRFLTTTSTALGLLIAVIAFVVWLLASVANLTLGAQVRMAEENAAEATQELLNQAMLLRASPLRLQIARFAELNEELIKIGGWLKEYRIVNTRAEWTAVIPPSMTADIVQSLGGRTKEITDEGIVITGSSSL